MTRGWGRGGKEARHRAAPPSTAVTGPVCISPSWAPPPGRTSSSSQCSRQNPVQSHSDYHCQWKCLLLMGWANSRKNQWCVWGDLREKVDRLHSCFPRLRDSCISWLFADSWSCCATGMSSMCGANSQKQEGLQVLSRNERMKSHLAILSSPGLPPLQSSNNTTFAPWISLSRNFPYFR